MIRRKLSKFIPLDSNPNFVVESLDILDINSTNNESSVSSSNAPSPPPNEESKPETTTDTNENKPSSPSTLQRKQSIFMKPLEMISTRVRSFTNQSPKEQITPTMVAITDPFQLLPVDILNEILSRAVFYAPNNEVDQMISNLKNFTLVSQMLRKICTSLAFWQPIWNEIASPYQKEQMKLDLSDPHAAALILKKDCIDIQQQKIPICRSTVQFVNHTGSPEMHILIVSTSYGIGEMNLTRRLVNGSYSDAYDARIEDSYRKLIVVDRQEALLDITVPGCGYEEIMSSMKPQWLRGVEGMILVYACNSRSSFQELEAAWVHPFTQIRDETDVPLVLVCNKMDIFPDQRQVTREEGLKLAAKLQCPYVETSAKSNVNTQQPWIEIVRQIRYHRYNKVSWNLEAVDKEAFFIAEDGTVTTKKECRIAKLIAPLNDKIVCEKHQKN